MGVRAVPRLTVADAHGEKRVRLDEKTALYEPSRLCLASTRIEQDHPSSPKRLSPAFSSPEDLDVNRQYRIGIGIVAGTVAVAALLAPLVPPPRQSRAGQDLARAIPPLGPFRFTESSGRAITDRDLADRVWIASFVFTRCRLSCPRISTAVKSLQDGPLNGTDVQFVSISVDPDHDTPEVLAQYARSFEADPDRWWFLTGPKAETYALIRDGFKLGVAPMDPSDPRFELMDIAHSEKLALVDRGNQVVGLFAAEDPMEVAALVDRVKRLESGWITRLPAVNASLNALGTILLLVGLGLIRSGRQRAHMICMVSALAVSTLFLTCYLVYHANIGGGVPFQGTGLLRHAYFTVLISHVVLAAGVLPLILLTVTRAFRRRFDTHARIARVTYPIWLYVSITGVVVYLMLYQLDVSV